MNLDDWSPHLQKIVALEKHAHQELNSKKYRDAYENLLEMEHHCRMARAWILSEQPKEKE